MIFFSIKFKQPHFPLPASQMSTVKKASSPPHLTRASTPTTHCASPPKTSLPSPSSPSPHPSPTLHGPLGGNVTGLGSDSLLKDTPEAGVRECLTSRIPPRTSTAYPTVIMQAKIILDRTLRADIPLYGSIIDTGALSFGQTFCKY